MNENIERWAKLLTGGPQKILKSNKGAKVRADECFGEHVEKMYCQHKMKKQRSLNSLSLYPHCIQLFTEMTHKTQKILMSIYI